MKKDSLAKILGITAAVFMMIGIYAVNKYKAKITEASKLPFHKVSLADTADGTYQGKTYLSYAHLQLEVTVENHNLKDIKILECDGLEVVKAKSVPQKMIQQNSIVVPAAKGEELGTMIFISCVDSALYVEPEQILEAGETVE